jgi:hypothetical protein
MECIYCGDSRETDSRGFCVKSNCQALSRQSQNVFGDVKVGETVIVSMATGADGVCYRCDVTLPSGRVIKDIGMKPYSPPMLPGLYAYPHDTSRVVGNPSTGQWINAGRWTRVE